MPKEKAPAFQTYAGDFINDINVRSMTLDEVGMYWLLLCHAWIEDGLPDDDEIIEVLCFNTRQTSVGRAFNEIWTRVKPRFELSSDGRLRNKRQEVIRSNLQEFRKQRSRAGKASAEARSKQKGKSNTRSTPVEQACNSLSLSSSLKDNNILPGEAEALASDLRDIIISKKKYKVDKRKLSQWGQAIDKLMRLDGIEFPRQSTVMNWYRKHVGGEYVPVVYSGDAWRTKFLKMEDAMQKGVDQQGNHYSEVDIDEYQDQLGGEVPLGQGEDHG